MSLEESVKMQSLLKHLEFKVKQNGNTIGFCTDDVRSSYPMGKKYTYVADIRTTHLMGPWVTPPVCVFTGEVPILNLAINISKENCFVFHSGSNRPIRKMYWAIRNAGRIDPFRNSIWVICLTV